MNIDAQFLTSLWSIHRLRKIATSDQAAYIIEAQTESMSNAIKAAMNGEAIITPSPASGPYNYYRDKWVQTGDERYLKLMTRHVRDDS